MITHYYLTVTTTGLTIHQVRAVMSHFGWKVVFCYNFTDRGRQYVQWSGVSSCRRDTAEEHAVLVSAFMEQAEIFSVQTTWEKEVARCPECLRPIRQCMCDLLADNTLADPEDEE